MFFRPVICPRCMKEGDCGCLAVCRGSGIDQTVGDGPQLYYNLHALLSVAIYITYNYSVVDESFNLNHPFRPIRSKTGGANGSAAGGGRFLRAFFTFKSQSFIPSSRTSRTPEVFHLILPVSIVRTIRIQICKANNNNNNNLLTSHSGAAYGELLCVCFPRAFCQSLHFVSFLLICKASMRGQGFWFTVVEEKEVRT